MLFNAHEALDESSTYGTIQGRGSASAEDDPERKNVLVVGQDAVFAVLVSPIMVIVISVMTIGSFASLGYSASIVLYLQ